MFLFLARKLLSLIVDEAPDLLSIKEQLDVFSNLSCLFVSA